MVWNLRTEWLVWKLRAERLERSFGVVRKLGSKCLVWNFCLVRCLRV